MRSSVGCEFTDRYWKWTYAFGSIWSRQGAYDELNWIHFWCNFTHCVRYSLQVYQLISRRRFQQMEVLEGQNILVTISGKKNRVRVYYLSWLKSKILRTDGLSDVSLFFLLIRAEKLFVILIMKLAFPASGTTQWMDQRWWFARCRTFQNRQVWTHQILGDSIKRFDRNLCMGSEAVSQIHGIQSM